MIRSTREKHKIAVSAQNAPTLLLPWVVVATDDIAGLSWCETAGLPHGPFERIQKARTVSLCKALAAALTKRVGGAQVCHEVACRQHIADIGLCQSLAVVLEDQRARLDAFCRQWNVAR